MSERVAGGLGAAPRVAPARKLADDEKIPTDRFQALAGDRVVGGPPMAGMMGGRMMGGRPPMAGMMGSRPGGRMGEAFASSGSRQEYPGISGLRGGPAAAGARPSPAKSSKAVEAIAAAAKASAEETERVKGAAGDVTGTLASQMSESEAMATVRLSVEKHLDTLQQSMAGEGDVAKATEAIRGAAGTSEPFALLCLDLIVRRMILCQRGGDAKVFGALLASLAGVQSKKAGKGRRGKGRRAAGASAGDAAAPGLVSVDQVVATLEAAAAFLLGGEPANDSVLRDTPRALAPETAADEAQAAVDRAVEAASKAGEELAEEDLEVVARRAKDSVLSRAQSFPRSLKEGVAEAIEAGLFEKAAMPGRELRRLCAQEGMEGVPEPDAVVEAPSAAAAAAAAASAEPANVRVAAAVEAALASGLTGDEAVEAATAAFEAVAGAESTDIAWGVTRAVLKTAIVREQLTLAAPWAADEALGPVISAVCDEKLAESVAALDAVVSVAIDLSYPNGMLVGAFKGLFDEDCIDDSAFAAWKSGPRGPLSGKAKNKALKQLADFFVWLEKEMAESDDEEEEEA